MPTTDIESSASSLETLATVYCEALRAALQSRQPPSHHLVSRDDGTKVLIDHWRSQEPIATGQSYAGLLQAIHDRLHLRTLPFPGALAALLRRPQPAPVHRYASRPRYRVARGGVA